MSKSDKKREERLAEALRANLRKRKSLQPGERAKAQDKTAPDG
jgi:hypothetical protein